MFFNQIKFLFRDAIFYVVSHMTPFLADPDKDFTRRRKLPPETLISFLVSQGASSTGNELDGFFDFHCNAPSPSAINQQRDKLKPQVLEEVFHQLLLSLLKLDPPSPYRFLAADGSSFSFFSTPKLAPDEYFVSGGHSAKGFYSVHLNALYDLNSHTYMDAVIQPVHFKDESKAFCTMVDRLETLEGTSDIFIADRGYCSYNNMAHVLEKNQFFLFRSKDVNVRGIAGHLPLPKQGSFDLCLDIVIKRSHSRKIKASGDYVTFVGAASAFDFLPYGSLDTYTLPVRVVRFPLDDGSYECIMTNLPADEFTAQDIKRLYFSRWGTETSFRKLKYTIGLGSFHSYKPEFIKQEIWAKLIAYNLTETVINHTVVETRKNTKHSYKVNFTEAAHICRVFFRLHSRKHPADVIPLLSRKPIPVRKERSFPRLQTAHFRRPRYFLYRAA